MPDGDPTGGSGVIAPQVVAFKAVTIDFSNMPKAGNGADNGKVAADTVVIKVLDANQNEILKITVTITNNTTPEAIAATVGEAMTNKKTDNTVSGPRVTLSINNTYSITVTHTNDKNGDPTITIAES